MNVKKCSESELELLLNCFRTSLECSDHEVQSGMQCRCFTLYAIKISRAVHPYPLVVTVCLLLVLAAGHEAPKVV